MRTKRTILAVFILLLPLAFLSSQETEDIKPILAEIQKAGGLKEHPDANALIIFEDTNVVFQESGEFTAIEHSLVKILTDKGKQTFAAKKLPYHRRYSTINVLLARVIKPDGRVVPVPKEAMKDGTMEETQQVNILEENFRRISITFPSVELGDSIETIVETQSKPLIKGHYNDLMVFQYFEPMLRKQYIIEGPASLPLNHVAKNGTLEFSRQEKGNRVVYEWKVLNSPKIEQEVGMAPITDVALKVIASTFKNWAELSRYGDSLNVGKVDSNEAVKAKVAELTKDSKTEEEKILAIFHYISRKVRYMGSSMDLGAFIEPHQATYTFEKQYGICRDKSILMISMLNEIGIKAYDAIINISRQTDPEIPIIFFEHAICGVILQDGRIVYMDPTLELSSGFGETYVGGRYVLLLDKDGKDLLKLPSVPAEKSLGLIKGETRLLPDGSIEGKVNISGKGFYDLLLRSVAKQVPIFQLPMVWSQLGQNLATTIKIENLKAGDFADLAGPFEIAFDYRARDYTVDTGKLTMLKIPFSSQAFDLTSVSLFQILAAREERKYPISLPSTLGCREEEVITIPPGYRIRAVPDPIQAREGPVSLILTTSIEGDKIFFASDFRIETPTLGPEEYQGLRKVVKELRRFQKAMIILEKAEGEGKGGRS